ncbi:serine/threonine-protein kinase haspin [Cygnus atratus]|uniref:serine/threonine-protein kinase haspin n=1 Tax=Cygnus atratus TaxID=8868 RepID=UPI0015D57878|nr:serine/threonine-protein kinase haspin [Cygnus atratus]
MPLQPRLLRTYSRRGGHLRPLPQPARWISPPQDRRRLFSSTSAGSSSACSSALSAASDDPDFSPPGKRRRQPLCERPARARCLRSRRGAASGENENRPPAPAVLSSPSPSPLPPAAARRRQGPSHGARRPLLCSTPQLAPSRSRRSPPAELSSRLEGGSGLQGSLALFSSPREGRDASLGSGPSTPQSLRGDAEEVEASPSGSKEGTGLAWSKALGGCGERGLSQRASRVLRASVRVPRFLQQSTSTPPTKGEPLHSTPYAGARAEEPCDDVERDSTEGSLSGQRGKTKHQPTPVVVLNRQEVSLWLTSMQADKKADAQPSCQKPVSPLGPQGMVEYKNKSTKVSSAEGSACRRACISGFSARRWDRQMRLCPQRLKNKRQQHTNNSLFRPQLRPKGRKKGGQEMAVDTRDNDSSFLNNSHAWGRLRASLSFHKKKKVTADECSYNSILCTPFVNSEVTGHQETPTSSMTQYCALSASSMVLLAPRNSCSVLEVMLTDAEKVFGECHQERPITFEECIPLDKMKDCKKIGEGVFGEVFQIDSKRGPVALKIIPIEGTERVNGESQKRFGEILPEIIISKELSLLSEESVNRTVGFVSLYSVHCVQGAYPKYLLEAWDKYDKVTGSENDRPDLFRKEQLFMVLEFEFGGSDLENMRNSLSSVASAKSILHQVTASLAVAEQELHFEHRDLHWGNVLVKKTDVKELNYVLNGTMCTIPTRGIHVNIIDYTLSRLEKDGLTVFCDLSTDEELFQGTGDYQFDIYRQMKAENSNSWTDYHPHSNVLWLHYLSDKLLKDMVYKKKESTSAMRKIKQQLVKFHKEVLTFGSASEVLHSSSLFQ